MALASASGTPFDKDTVKNDGGAVLNIGDSDKFGNLNITKASSSPKNQSGPVERDGDVGSTSDRAGVQKANSSQSFAKPPESNLVFGAGVNDNLNSRDYSGSLDNDATNAARGILKTTAAGSGALAGFDIFARPDAEISTGRTRPANAGRAVEFIDPETGLAATTSGIKPTRGNPGSLRWNFGGTPQKINYKSKERGEFELSAPASEGGSGPAGLTSHSTPYGDWTSNYDTAEFQISWKPSRTNYSISLALESVGPTPSVYFNRETQDDFEIQIDWGDGATDTVSGSNIAAQNHQYADQSSRTITATSTGNAWPDWHQATEWLLNGGDGCCGNFGSSYQFMYFQEPPGTNDTMTGLDNIDSITSWGGLFTGFEGIIGGTSVFDSWTGSSSSIPKFVYWTNGGAGIVLSKQVRGNDNIPDTGFEMPDHVPNTTSLRTFFMNLWESSTEFVDTSGNPIQIPAVETENFARSVYQITDLESTFANCVYYIPDISRWRTDNVTNMEKLFYLCRQAPSIDISSWNTSNVTNMQSIFRQYDNFNADISNWDTGSLVDAREMFYQATSFNQDIGSWDTSNVTFMYRMFYQATSFNQDISSWDFSSVTNMNDFLYQATSFSQANYDALLIRWAEQADVAGGVLQNITPRISANYTLGGAAAAARAELVNTHGWNIFDNGGV